MTHDQIARYMGSAREVVSRMLKYFAQEGLVKLWRGGLTVLDKPRLPEDGPGRGRRPAKTPGITNRNKKRTGIFPCVFVWL